MSSVKADEFWICCDDIRIGASGVQSLYSIGQGDEVLAEGLTHEQASLLAAAQEMLDALRRAVFALNVAPRFSVGDADSYEIASQCSAAIRKAEGRGE